MNLIHHSRKAILTCVCLLMLSACEQATPPAAEPVVESSPADAVQEAAASVTLLADRFYANALEMTPEIAYFSGVESAAS